MVETEKACVILLHGIFRTSRHMQKLSDFLCVQGYDVLNIDYPSTKQPLQDLVDIVWQDIVAICKQHKPVHFVGYSMGGLLIRALLNKYRPAQLGRVVLLAPPNKGSEVADNLKNIWLYKKLYGPAGQQLITDQSEIQHLFGEIFYECGVIAGSLSLDPISSFFIEGKDDGKVSIERTKVPGMADHIVIKASHTFFPQSKGVQRQTAYFLQNGKFER